MSRDTPSEPPAPDPQRFEVSKGTLLLDRTMTQLIRVGGLAVILAVFGIFFFIVKEIIPLFSEAEVEAEKVVRTPVEAPAVLGVDEWGEKPFLYRGGDEVVVVDIHDGAREVLPVPSLEGVEVTAVSYDPVHRRVAVGLADGRVGSFRVDYQTEFGDDGERRIVATVESEPWFEVGVGEGPVAALGYGDGGAERILIVAREEGLAALRLGQKRALIGKPKLTLLGTSELSGFVSAEVATTVASQNGKAALVATTDGEVSYFLVEGGEDRKSVV